MMTYPELTRETLAAEGMREGLFNIPEDFYHEIDALSQSRLKEYARSPAHYRAACQSPSDDENPLFVEGKAWHMALLEPVLFANSYAAEPQCDKRTKAGKEAHAEWLASNSGKISLPPDIYARIVEGVKVLRSDGNLMPYITGGIAELGMLSLHPVHKLWMKGKLDYWIPGRRLIVDYKTTSSLEDFGRSIIKYGYLVQAAYYTDMMERLTGAQITGFAILAMEKKAPYAYKIFMPTDRAIQSGRDRYQRYLEKHVNCLATNSWPIYDNLIEIYEPDEWFFRREG